MPKTSFARPTKVAAPPAVKAPPPPPPSRGSAPVAPKKPGAPPTVAKAPPPPSRTSVPPPTPASKKPAPPKPHAAAPVDPEPEPFAPGAQSRAVVVVRESKAALVEAPVVRAIGQVVGQVENSDFRRPQLKISGYIGPLFQLGLTPGYLVVGSGDQWTYLHGDSEGFTEPLGVTVVIPEKDFVGKEDADDNSYYDMEDTETPSWSKKEDMQAAGFSLAKIEGIGLAEPRLKCVVLVRKPANVEDEMGLFDTTIPGVEGEFMLASWVLRGSSYSECGPWIFAASRGAHKSHHTEFQVMSKEIVGTKNKWFIPKIFGKSVNEESVIAWIEANA